MSFSIRTVRDGIVTVLTNNNVTTSSWDLSGGLQTRAKLISQGNPNITPIGLTQYPYVLVQPDTVSEKPDQIGANNTKRDVDIVMKIYAGVCEPSTRTNSEDEIYKLAENIQTIARNNLDMGGTVSWIEGLEVNYGTDDTKEILVHTAEITMQMHVIAAG